MLEMLEGDIPLIVAFKELKFKLLSVCSTMYGLGVAITSKLTLYNHCLQDEEQ